MPALQAKRRARQILARLCVRFASAFRPCHAWRRRSCCWLAPPCCVTWLVSPASSAPQTREPAVAASPAETTAALDDLDTQLDQLRQRLAAPGALAPPTRDPFSFAPRATPPSRRDAPSPAEEEPGDARRTRSRRPTLVAILDFATGTPPVRRAALGSRHRCTNRVARVTRLAPGRFRTSRLARSRSWIATSRTLASTVTRVAARSGRAFARRRFPPRTARQYNVPFGECPGSHQRGAKRSNLKNDGQIRLGAMSFPHGFPQFL